MTTQTRNEAAERLRSISKREVGGGVGDQIRVALDLALAAERRVTVERIDKVVAMVQERDRPPRTEWQSGYSVAMAEFRAILDEEAAR